ncbi:hypothetical protein CVT25_002438 [Psilocybe cyanescens]|uniref:Uncharacterized protein n=1 Tax=Psilocybe cyanescens TaxID=93625 RepID=A0A409WKC7_PSICY|nr:hypothetical protein CVT25_002438 [Psilocybe cyanescens]
MHALGWVEADADVDAWWLRDRAVGASRDVESGGTSSRAGHRLDSEEWPGSYLYSVSGSTWQYEEHFVRKEQSKEIGMG